jgi:hypothetical protein
MTWRAISGRPYVSGELAATYGEVHALPLPFRGQAGDGRVLRIRT